MEVHRVEQSIAKFFDSKSWAGRTVIVAVSGGPDSVACLLSAVRVAKSNKQVVAAHFNHQWRGDASNADAQFVRELSERLGVRLIEGQLDTHQPETERTEEKARRSRYEFLTKTAYAVGAGYVVTGHTADDRIETMLHNLFRGSGLTGLAAPRAYRSLDEELVLVRPLLGVYRCQIIDYLALHKQEYRMDTSNSDNRYTRNFIRNNLLPLVREHFTSGVDKQLLSMAELAEESMLALERLGAEWLEEMRIAVEQMPAQVARQLPSNGFWMAPRIGFAGKPWPIVREGLRQLWTARSWELKSMSRRHWERIREIVSSEQPSQVLADTDSVRTLLTLPSGLKLIAVGHWFGFGFPP